MMDKRIGAQLYTIRQYTQTLDSFDQALEKISKIGYKAIQVSCVGPFKAEEIKTICDKHQLIPVCTHRSWDEYCNHLEESIQFHKTLGCQVAGLGAIPNLRTGFTWDDLVRFVEKMNQINKEFKKNGITFAYHNHDVEFSKVEGKRPMDYILEHAEFDFIVDVYWLAASGVDPARFIKKVGNRAKIVHFKDITVIENGKGQKIAEVMEGNLDWDSIIEACQSAGVEWAMVELDTCERDPFDSLQNSYKNLSTKGFY